MATLLDHLQLLRGLAFGADDAFRARVVEHFRDEYLRLFEADKQAYLQSVFERQLLSNAQMATLLGYRSRSAINAICDGSIAHDKFELLLATLGAVAPWRSAADRRTRTLVATVQYVHEKELRRPVKILLNLEGCECLEQAFCEDLLIRELEHERELEAWLKALFRRVRAVVEIPGITTEEQLHQLLIEWGPAFLKTKDALHPFLRES